MKITNLNIRYNNKAYTTIQKDPLGLGFVLSDGKGDTQKIDYSNEKYGLYKIQDIEKALILYTKEYQNLVFPLDKIEKTNGLRYLFSINEDGTFNFDKTALHSTFKNFNKALLGVLESEKKNIFIFDENGLVTLFKNNRHYKIANNGEYYSKSKNKLNKKEKIFVDQVLEFTKETGEIKTALTKIFGAYNC